jgi:hypothetical protein
MKQAIVAGSVMPLMDMARANQNNVKRPFSICIFSKHLQWLDYNGMAQTTAELGFDGIDLVLMGLILPSVVGAMSCPRGLKMTCPKLLKL